MFNMLFKSFCIFTAFSILFEMLPFFFNDEKEAGLDWEDDVICIFKPTEGGVCYPRMYTLKNGTLVCGFDYNGKIAMVESHDNGKTWSKEPVIIAEVEQKTCANAAFVQLESGEILCAYRATGYVDGKFYGSLRVNSSLDNGKTWSFHSMIIETLQDSDNFNGVWEPHFGYIGDKLAVYYSNDSLNDAVEKHEYQNIEYKFFENGEWSEKHIACDGKKSDSRDGMPVWFQCSDGTYLLAIESTHLRDHKKEKIKSSFVIELLQSDDGMNWNNGSTVYIPSKKNGGDYAGAPYVVQLPDGRLCVSFQTNENVEIEGVSDAWTARIITTRKAYNGKVNLFSFTKPFAPFGKEGISNWNALYVNENYLFALTSKRDEDGARILLRRSVL